MRELTLSRHYRTSEEIDRMRSRMAGRLWKEGNFIGNCSMGAEHRLVIRYAYSCMFPGTDIDITDAYL